MSAAAGEDTASDITEDQVLARVAELCAADPALSEIGAALLVALDLGIARDTRTFSRVFGIAHALVLREVSLMSGDDGAFLEVLARNERTQRTELALTEKGHALLLRTRPWLKSPPD
jgi:hypothetical protein